MLEHAVAAAGEAGVDAEDEHAYERSEPTWTLGGPRSDRQHRSGRRADRTRAGDHRRRPPPLDDTARRPAGTRRRARRRHAAGSARSTAPRRPRPVACPRGRITVLLGPNGAGKTTAIRMITGALDADAGVGPHLRPRSRRRRRGGPPPLRRRVGQAGALRPARRAATTSRYSAELYGLGRGDDVDAGSARRPPASASTTRSTSRSAATRPA